MKNSNVIFILCDDLNDSLEAIGGHKNAKTPHISRLMEEGVRFTNCQSNAPICGPSRASMLTGIYPHSSGYFGYRQQQNHFRNNPVLKDAATFMEHFSNNGYSVYGTGKIFHNGHEDWSVWKGNGSDQGFGIRPDFGPWPWNGKEEGKGIKMPHPSMPPKLKTHWEDSFGPLSQIPDYKTDDSKEIPGYRGWRLQGKPFCYEDDEHRDLMSDELSVDWTIDVLNKDHENPFMLAVGLNRPHTPLYAPKRFFDMFPLEEIELPPYLASDLEDCAKSLSEIPAIWTQDYGFIRFQNLRDSGGESMWKQWIQAYLACVAFVDYEIGRLLQALKQSRYGDNTLVVLTSDNGYHMGEKSYLFKNSLWEESCRIPLVISGPGLAQDQECNRPVSLVDLYPTFIEYCSLSEEPNADSNQQPIDGVSLLPLLIHPEGGWDGPKTALSVVAADEELGNDQPGSLERQYYSLRSETWRYIICPNGEEELYNHDKDPHEWHNLAGDHTCHEVKLHFRETLKNMTKMNEKRGGPLK